MAIKILQYRKLFSHYLYMCALFHKIKKFSISIAEYSPQVSNKSQLFKLFYKYLVFYLPIYIPIYYSLTLQLNLTAGEYNQTVLYFITIHFILITILFTTLSLFN